VRKADNLTAIYYYSFIHLLYTLSLVLIPNFILLSHSIFLDLLAVNMDCGMLPVQMPFDATDPLYE
jgi:hypothetical protein